MCNSEKLNELLKISIKNKNKERNKPKITNNIILFLISSLSNKYGYQGIDLKNKNKLIFKNKLELKNTWQKKSYKIGNKIKT
ncbi:hypothetical protein AKH17_03815 [Pelagibacteraceae bacterium GOM-A2]|nr:hypothetical protein AKH17_03815 [Pelagibacteraceae bacterium GOM-A2]